MATTRDYDTPDFSEKHCDSIDDLDRIGKKGWRTFKKHCNQLGFFRNKEFGLISLHPVTPIWLTATEIYNEIREGSNHCGQPEFRSILPLAAFSKRDYSKKKYYDIYHSLPTDQEKPSGGRLKKALEKTLNILTNLEPSDELAASVLTPENYKRYQNDLPDNHREPIIDEVSLKIDKRWRECFKLLLDALRGDITEDEAWWNCAWLYTVYLMDKLKKINANIRSNTPLTDEQVDYLNGFIQFGQPRGRIVLDSKGRETYEVSLSAQSTPIHDDRLEQVASAALIQPAYRIAKDAEKSMPRKPRYRRTCRAPRCGKVFYTGRSDATACPGSKGHRKNKCALGWTAYSRWLQKIGRNPKKDWDEQELQQLFLKR